MNHLTTLPSGLIALLVPLLILCIGCILWSILPARTTRADRLRSATEQFDADIERQIATLRAAADHGVTHRPRVRAGGYIKGPTTFSRIPRREATVSPKPCGGGMCRHRADCPDHYCPGRPAITPAKTQ